MAEKQTIGEIIEVTFAALSEAAAGQPAALTDARECLQELRDLLARYGLQRLRAKSAFCAKCGTDISLEFVTRGAKECDRCSHPAS